MGIGAIIGNKLKSDANFARLGYGIVLGARGVQTGAGRYLSDKVPIVQWVTNYSPKWILGDVIAGQSVGILLLPQALMYSTIAGVPIQQALLASWLPGLIYAIMGTSRDISIGPTMSSAAFTGQIVLGLAPSKVPAPLVAAVVSFCVGIWSMIFGILNLGFIFDFVSIPMALGFTMGISFVVLTSQIPDILGLSGITGGFMDLMPQIIKHIGQSRPTTFGIGATTIAILALLQFVGKKWGRKSPIIAMICSSRYLFVLGAFTMVSMFVNKSLDIPLWSIIGPIKTTVPSPAMPIMQLVNALILPSLAVFFSNALEHVALAKAFGDQNGYTFNPTQEVFSIGVINLINSIFGGLPVGGGDMTRSSVLAGSGSKSPLNGVFSSITVFVSMFALSNTFQWLPSAAVAGATMVAIIDQMPPQALIGAYWKVSFVDFVHFILAFNLTMLNGGEIGIGLSLFFMIGYTLMRVMFSRPSAVVSVDLENKYSNDAPVWWSRSEIIPSGIQVVTLETDVVFFNAARVRRHIVDTVYTHNHGVDSSIHPLMRPWNVNREKHVARLRLHAGLSTVDTFTPRFRTLVLDMTATSFIDTTGIKALERMRADLVDYGGEDVEFRFVGMNKGVRTRFARAGWKLTSPHDEDGLELGQRDTIGDSDEMKEELVEKGAEERKGDMTFDHLPSAIQYVRSQGAGSAYRVDVDMDSNKF